MRILLFFVFFYVFGRLALGAEIITRHPWVGVASISVSLVALIGALVKLHLNLEEVPIRKLIIGFLMLIGVQITFVAAVRMPHSIVSSLLVIAVIAGLPFINGDSRSTRAAKKASVDDEDLTKTIEPRDA